ncbi:retrovirus-related pol polyprotein from transposon TNT 1-94, partial [Tanacetum coccineum]
GAIPSKTAANAKIAIQEMAKYSQKWHNGTSRSRSTETSDGLEAIQAQLNNLGREIKKVNEKVYAAQVGCEQCKGSHYTKDCPLKEEAVSCSICRIGSSQYAVSTGQNHTLMYETRQMTIPFLSRLNGYYFELKKGSYGLQFLEAYSEASHINNSIPRKEKDPGRASISVMPLSTYLNLGLGELAHTKLTVELADRTMKYPKGIAENMLITLRVREERIVFTSVKPASSLIKRVYMLSLRERMELDLEARLMGETLVLNISLDPFFDDYIELNDLNEPFKLRRNQADDLMPTIEEGEVIKEFRTRDDEIGG